MQPYSKFDRGQSQAKAAGMNPRLFRLLAVTGAVLLFASPAFAQDGAEQPCPSASGSIQPAPKPCAEDRIVDKPLRPGKGKAIARIPLFPFIGLGKAFEKGLLAVEEHNLEKKGLFALRWLAEHHVAPAGGSSDFGPGAGFGLGVRLFDNDFLGASRIRAEMPVAITLKNYQLLAGRMNFALQQDRRLFLEIGGRYRNMPEEDFFGLGPYSEEGDRTSFKLQDRLVRASLGSEFLGTGRVEVLVDYVNSNVGNGRDDKFPDTGTVFPGMPGSVRGSSLMRYGVRGVLPLVDRPGNPHRGIHAEGRWLVVDSVNSDNFSYYDYGAEVEGYIPLGETRTVVVRALGDFRSSRDGGQVPYYMLPFLGGRDSMRGFREYRFHDNNAVLFNLEYRLRVWKLLDTVVFSDWGQVGPRISSFEMRRFRNSVGAGLRFHSTSGVFFRVDVGRSSEGVRTFFTFGREFVWNRR
jgi:hypothetical protein